MPSADDISRTIEPGSLPQGDRQVVAANLQAALGGAGQPTSGELGPPQGAPDDEDIDPLDYLQQESVSDLPVTAGLSLGPGNAPAQAPRIESAKTERLRLLATQAQSPVLRQLARQALRAELRRT